MFFEIVSHLLQIRQWERLEKWHRDMTGRAMTYWTISLRVIDCPSMKPSDRKFIKGKQKQSLYGRPVCRQPCGHVGYRANESDTHTDTVVTGVHQLSLCPGDLLKTGEACKTE